MRSLPCRRGRVESLGGANSRPVYWHLREQVVVQAVVVSLPSALVSRMRVQLRESADPDF